MLQKLAFGFEYLPIQRCRVFTLTPIPLATLVLQLIYDLPHLVLFGSDTDSYLKYIGG